jgi:hypothetical protein
MKKFMFAIVAMGMVPVAYAGETQSVLAPTPAPAPVVQPVEVASNCANGRCCTNGRCYVVREPRFERNVSVTTTCDSCGVKETARTVTRTRRWR